MNVGVRCPIDDAEEARWRLELWAYQAEAGSLTGDELLSELNRIGDLVDSQRSALSRALGR